MIALRHRKARTTSNSPGGDPTIVPRHGLSVATGYFAVGRWRERLVTKVLNPELAARTRLGRQYATTHASGGSWPEG